MSRTITFSNYRVDCVDPSDPGQTFEPRCYIVADDAQFDGDTVRVFDVPDPDESQRAVAAFACKAMNAHNEMVAALEELRSTLTPVLRDHEVRGNADRTEGYVLVAVNRIDAALAMARAA